MVNTLKYHTGTKTCKEAKAKATHIEAIFKLLQAAGSFFVDMYFSRVAFGQPAKF